MMSRWWSVPTGSCMSRRWWYAHQAWQMGRDYGIPVCCRLRYCFDGFIGRRDMFLRRGRVERYGECDGWVPCKLWHGRHSGSVVERH